MYPTNYPSDDWLLVLGRVLSPLSWPQPLMILWMTSPLWAPFALWALQWHNRRWSVALAVLVLYFPGATYAYGLFDLNFSGWSPFDSWFYFWYDAIRTASGGFIVFWFFTGIGLILWFANIVVARKKGQQRSLRSTWHLVAFSIGLLLLMSPATYYLATYTTLEQAVRDGNVVLAAKRLHSNLLGVDANTGDITGISSGPVRRSSLLPIAFRTNNVEMVRLLLDNGAKLESSHLWGGGENYMASASSECDLEVIALLLDHGGDPNDGLHKAARANRLDVLHLLISRGADVYTLDQSGKTVLDAAVVGKADDVIRFLSPYDLPLTDLHGFIDSNQLEAFKQAIEAGYDVNGLYDDQLLLHHAVRLKRAAFVEYLMQKGAKPLLFSIERRKPAETPLHVAVRYDAVEEVRIMTRYGVDPDILNEKGLTPLYVAAAWSSSEMVEALIEAGANVNFVSPYNPRISPLIETLDKPRQLEVERILLEHGADPNLGGYEKPLTYAVHHLNAEGVRLLLEFGAKLDGDPKEPVLLDKFNGMYGIKSPESVARMLATAEVLVDFGADPEARVPGTGRSVIEEAEYRENTELAQYLRSRLAERNP